MSGRWWLVPLLLLVVAGAWHELGPGPDEEGSESSVSVPDAGPAMREHPVAPGCRLPVTLHLDQVDAQFGLEEREVRAALRDAREMWESVTDTTLFRDRADEGVAVRLVFDERQASALARQRDREGLDAAYEEIERRRERLEDARADLEADIRRHAERREELEERGEAHRREVEAWNAGDRYRGDRRRARLEDEGEAIRERGDELNREARQLEERRGELERRAAELDAAIARYNERADGLNERSQQAGGFNVGLYEQTPGERSITVYQAVDREQLTLVLAHELGHALGIGHVSDPEAVMYATLGPENAGRSRLTQADRHALEQACDVTTRPASGRQGNTDQ